MSASLAPVRFDEHERQQLLADGRSPSRLDRLELRLGLWLLLRSARRRAVLGDRDRHRARVTAAAERSAREYDAWRHLALGTVRA